MWLGFNSNWMWRYCTSHVGNAPRLMPKSSVCQRLGEEGIGHGPFDLAIHPCITVACPWFIFTMCNNYWSYRFSVTLSVHTTFRQTLIRQIKLYLILHSTICDGFSMESLESIVWNTKVPLRINLSSADRQAQHCACTAQLHVSTSTISFLPIIIPQVQKHFKPETENTNQLWFSYQGSPIRSVGGSRFCSNQ